MDPRKENDQGVCCYATRQGKRVSLPYIPVAVRYALDKVVFGDVTVVEHANQTEESKNANRGAVSRARG